MRTTAAIIGTAWALVALVTLGANAWTPVSVHDDPLVCMPGTQPQLDSNFALEAPNRCLNCHADYDPAVEPGFNWQGSMMAQAARDFLFWSCLTVAAQDAIWAVGTPNAVDICERCHFPKGWLEGRSEPANASSMTNADFDGVQCDFCHTAWDPFFEATHNGTREDVDWDETNASGTPSDPAADGTYAEDATIAPDIALFNGDPFYVNNKPPENYLENGSGQFFISPNSDKRASFADAAARHQMRYSRYHKSKYFCGVCHDVSNPVLANLGADPALALPTETNSAFTFFHVERTFSEFMLSAYGQPGGADTNQDFQNQGAPDIAHASKCQDCHMRDVRGVGCNKNGVPIRPDESVEHPNSGQPLHDMTGGNVWVSWVLASAITGHEDYDAFNETQLNNDNLTLDLSQGEVINPAALLAGVERAKQQLLLAATIKNLNYDAANGELSFQVQNNSAHKLISGFPEGRRMFVNIKAYQGGNPIYEVNPYDTNAGTLKGLDYPYQTGMGVPVPLALETNELYVDELVYEMKPSSTDLTGETKTFHFALATGRYKDNRIPPKGFNIDGAAARLSRPVWQGAVDPDYFTEEEYANGYDNVSLPIPTAADSVIVSLFYQTTSREYIEFLRDEISGAGNLTLYGPDNGGVSTHAVAEGLNPDNNNAYLAQTDPFFSQLSAWGETIWALWMHNMNVDGAAPILMAQATYGSALEPCNASTPALDALVPGTSQIALSWTDKSSDADVIGYRLYYDQAGKSQLLTAIGNPATTTYIDTDLLGGVPHCYKVTSYSLNCESNFSEVLCATPYTPGDLDNNWNVELNDGILGLQLLAGIAPAVAITPYADVDQNQNLGLQEALYILQILAEIR